MTFAIAKPFERAATNLRELEGNEQKAERAQPRESSSPPSDRPSVSGLSIVIIFTRLLLSKFM